MLDLKISVMGALPEGEGLRVSTSEHEEVIEVEIGGHTVYVNPNDLCHAAHIVKNAWPNKQQ